VTPPNEDDVRGLDDAALHDLQHLVADELRARAYSRVEPRRWTAGRLRADLRGLPDDMPLLVNVGVECPGQEVGGFIPLVVVDGGFTVSGDENGPPEDEILRIYNIETEPVDPSDGRLVWIIASA